MHILVIKNCNLTPEMFLKINCNVKTTKKIGFTELIIFKHSNQISPL